MAKGGGKVQDLVCAIAVSAVLKDVAAKVYQIRLTYMFSVQTTVHTAPLLDKEGPGRGTKCRSSPLKPPRQGGRLNTYLLAEQWYPDR